MPIFNITDISREASNIYYEGLKRIRACNTNPILLQSIITADPV